MSMRRTIPECPESDPSDWLPADCPPSTRAGRGRRRRGRRRPGTFTYSPAAGTVLAAGQQLLTATFTPTDTVDYTTATATVTLTVIPISPVITLTTTANPVFMTYGVSFTASLSSNASSATGTITFTMVPFNLARSAFRADRPHTPLRRFQPACIQLRRSTPATPTNGVTSTPTNSRTLSPIWNACLHR